MDDDRLDDPRPAADASEEVHEAVLALLKSEPPGRLLDAPAGEGAFALHARKRGYTVVCWVPNLFHVHGAAGLTLKGRATD